MYNEATVNYDNSRFQDSATTFEYLIRECAKEQNYVDAIYFSYRAIDTWMANNSPGNTVKVWKNLSTFALKVTRQVADESLKHVEDLEVKLTILQELDEALIMLRDNEAREQVLNNLYETYITIANEFDRKISDRIFFLKKAKELPLVISQSKLNNVNKLLAPLQQLHSSKTQNNEIQRTNKPFDTIQRTQKKDGKLEIPQIPA